MHAFLFKGKTDIFFQFIGKYILGMGQEACPAGPGQNSSGGAGRLRI